MVRAPEAPETTRPRDRGAHLIKQVVQRAATSPEQTKEAPDELAPERLESDLSGIMEQTHQTLRCAARDPHRLLKSQHRSGLCSPYALCRMPLVRLLHNVACLNMAWFRARAEAKVEIARWRKHDDAVRPHSSLAYVTANAFAKTMKALPSTAVDTAGRTAALPKGSAPRPVDHPSRLGKKRKAEKVSFSS